MGLRNIQSLLTEQPESGAVVPGTSFTVKKTTRIYKFRSIYRDTVVQELGVAGGSEFDQGLNESDGYMIDYSIEAQVGYSILTCLFSDSVGVYYLPSVRKLTNLPFFSQTQSPGNIPLEQLSNFLTNWIYDLSAINGETTVPSWWATATTTTIPSGDETKYKWVKDTSQSQEGWYILKEKTKQGATEKQNSNAIIQEDIWTETRAKALTLKHDTTVIADPADKLGNTGQFLRLPSLMIPDGDLWKISTTYLNAETWDSDIYA
jgi:hypothetical protein